MPKEIKELFEKTHLKHNDKSQPSCKDMPELQCVAIGSQRMRRVPVVPISVNTGEGCTPTPILQVPNLFHLRDVFTHTLNKC